MPPFLSLSYANPPQIKHLSPFLLQSGGCGIPESAAGRPGGERPDDESGGAGGDVAGGVSAHPQPDHRGADPHPSGTAGPWRDRSTGDGEQQAVSLQKHSSAHQCYLQLHIGEDKLWLGELVVIAIHEC